MTPSAAIGEPLYYSELDAIHAFREGNSRTLRAFTSDLAQSVGHRLDWALTAQTEEQRMRLYHARDLAVMRGDTPELTQIFDVCLIKTLQRFSHHAATGVTRKCQCIVPKCMQLSAYRYLA